MAIVKDLNKLMESSESFYKEIDNNLNKIFTDYSTIKNDDIKLKFNKKNFLCSRANLVTQMFFFIPFMDLKDKYNLNIEAIPVDDFIIIDEIKDFNAGTSIKYFNKVINYFDSILDDNGDYIDDLNKAIKKCLNKLADLSGQCNILSGTTINIHDLLYLYYNDPEFKEIFDEKVPERMEFNDIENFVKNKFDKLMDILREEDTCFKPYFRSKTGINEKQFTEIISSIGLKADLDGNIIPYIVQDNFLKGLSSIEDYYITGILARKALITSHKNVKDSGYMTRKLSLLLMDTHLSDEEDCGTEDVEEIKIDNEETAKRYNLRYFVNANNEYERFDSDIHKNLIGKTLAFRTPIKCKCKNGVCHTCYGDLWKVNQFIHIGIEAVLELTEQLTQKMLSAKHLQKASTKKIEWQEDFLNLFIIDKASIYADKDKEKSGHMLIIDEDDLETDEDNNTIISRFIIRTKNGVESNIELPISLILGSSITNMVKNQPQRDKDNRIKISFKDLCELDESVFFFIMENNELSSSLKALVELIENKEHLGISEIDEMTNMMMSLLNDGSIHLSAVHAELILRELCRDINDYTKRAELFDTDAYTILKVSDAIFNSPSPSIGLSFEHVKKQLQSPELYKKDGHSLLDVMFFN